MKKRILSMLLLVAMIVTAVPVMSTAAGAETSSTATEHGDYRDLYVKDGLVNMYTAYVGDTSVNLSTGTWASALEGGTAATLGNKQYWVKGTYGGVGVTQLWGSYVNGVFTETADTNTFSVVGTRLDFGIDQLPTGSYAVEYVANYGHVMAVGEEGTPVQAINTIAGATWPTNAGATASYANAHMYNPVDQLGNLMILSLKRDYYNASPESYWGGMGQVFGKYAGFRRANMHNLSGGADNLQEGVDYNTLLVGGAGQTFHNFDTITTYEFNRDTVSDTEHTVAMVKGGSVYKSVASTISSAEEHTGGDDSFYLGERLTVDFYAVRIYNRTLTAAERAQNKMADVLGYYGIGYLENDAVIDAIVASAGSLAEYSLATDASEYEANKLAVQTFIDGTMVKELPYQLYVKDGMVGLFTAFDGAEDETVDLAAKTWANRVYGSNHKASLTIEKGAWKSGDFGGIGFDIFLGEINDAGEYTLVEKTKSDGTTIMVPKSSFSSLNYPYTYLNLGVSLLPDSDYTVDYLALYRHLYVADLEDSTAAGTGVPAKDANGNYLNAQDIPNVKESPDVRTWDTASQVFSEMLGNFVGQHQQLGLGEAWGGGAWAVRWGNASTHYLHDKVSWFSGLYSASGALHNGPSDPLQQNGVLQTYSYTRDETATTYKVTETVDGVETEVEKAGFDATFSIYRNASLYNSGSVAAASYKQGDSQFWLSGGRPTDFFAVRVYDRVLTVGELAQNRAADIALYYGLTLNFGSVSDEACMSRLLSLLGKQAFVMDAAEKSAKALELQAAVDAIKPADLDGLADMYVQDGLTALYTAFAGDAYVDLENGTWTDRVSGAVATLGNKQYWAQGANGGVGVTQLWGSYVNGVFTDEAETNTYDTLGTRLEFGIDQLPYSDYTVEYVADYNYIMAVGADGKPVASHVEIEAAGVTVTRPMSNMLNMGDKTNYAYTALDQLGNLHSFYGSKGHDYAFAVGSESYWGSAESVAFRYNTNRDSSGNGHNHGNGEYVFRVGNKSFHKRDLGVATYEISRAIAVEDAVETATFAAYYNLALFSSGTSTMGRENERGDMSYFYLGERASIDYYAVRIYARTLTAEERAQNRFVDILLYYGLEIPEETLKDENAMANIKGAIASESFVTDAAEYSAKKAQLQNVITPVFSLGGIADLYVKDGLTALYTAFAGDTYVDLEKGTWTDRVSGATATFGNKQYWANRANGGVGVTMTYGTFDEEGNFTAEWNAYSNSGNYGTQLLFGIEQLPIADYSIEYVAQYGYHMGTDAEGNIVDRVPAGMTPTANASGQYLSQYGPNKYAPVDQFGSFIGLSFRRDWGNNHNNWNTYGAPGSVNFMFFHHDTLLTGEHYWNQSMKEGYSNFINPGESGEIFYAPGAITTFEVSRTKVDDTHATYTLYKNASVFKSGTNSAYDFDFALERNSAKRTFYIGERMTVDFYAVRIYNRTLTAAEKTQNHFVDIVLYYGLTLDEYILEDEALLADLKAMFASETFVTDEAEYAAKKVALQKIIDNDIDLGGNANLYVTKGLVAMFTAFAGDEAYVDLENGTWTDRVSGATATLGNKQYWTMGANGGVGVTQTYGSYVDGEFVPEWNEYSNNDVYGTRLELGLDLLPDASYSIEYLAQYRYIMATDENGNIVDRVPAGMTPTAGRQDGSGAYVGGQWLGQYGPNKYAPVDQIGNLIGLSFHRDYNNTAFNTYGAPGATFFKVVNYGFTQAGQHLWNNISGGSMTEGSFINAGVSGEIFNERNKIIAYEISREKVSDTVATFNLYKNGNSFKSYTTSQYDYDYDIEQDATKRAFYLAERVSVDFYSVRIYNRTLTAAEKQQNHLADVVLYYGANIPENMLPGGDKYEQLATAIGSIGFVTDEVERAAMSLKIKATIRDIEKNGDLLSLYVQDNLVGLFTALNSLDGTASANGTWANRVVGNGSAQFVGGRWVKNTNGSVGTTQVYGSYINEEWSANSEYNTLTFDDAGKANGTATQLKLDSSLLDAMNDDYTLEYVAQYRPTMAVDANGNPVAESYVVGTLPSSGSASAEGIYGVGASIDQIGFMRSFSTVRDGYDRVYGRGVVQWKINHSFWSGYQGWQTPCGVVLWQAENGAAKTPIYYTNDQVITYAIVKDENDTHTAATFSLLKDGAVWMSRDYAEDSGVDFTVAEKSASANFYLADFRSVDFFAVRIYSDVLTTYEMAQNKAIDIAYYYALTIPEEVYTDADMLGALVSALSDAKIVTDAAERAALKAEYQARLDNLEVKEEVENVIDYNSLYVQDGLVGLYTAFAGDDAVNVMGGTWANAIDNEYGAATLRGASFWKRGTVGVGYTFESLEAYSENAYKVGIDLPETFADLETFTVEAFATAKGITNPDGSRYSQSGAVYYPLVKADTYVSGFRFGMLNALFFAAMNDGNADATRFAARWFVTNWSYIGYDATNPTIPGGNADRGTIIVRNYTNAAGVETYDDSDQGFRNMGPMYVPTAGVMQVSKVTDEIGDVTYEIHYDNKKAADDKSITITAEKYALYMQTARNSGKEGYFSLFSALPADVYAIRVYNRELTDAEKLQNSFVDKAGFYQIDLSEFASVENKTEIYEYFAEIGTDLSKEAAQAIYDMKVNGGTTVVGGSVLKFQKYLPILNGAYGYRVLFEVSEDSVAMIEDAFAGYSVHYGAIVAPASSNTVENLTINGVSSTAITTSATNGQVVVVGGDLGSNLFYNYTDIGMGVPTFSVAVTASDAALFGADMIVRAFVTITNADGVIVGTYYDEAVENEMLDGTVSIATAADYFVNEFEGDAATEYKYMNAATLRDVLKASGRDVTRVVANDLVIYVDPANGSDENDGKTLDTAFATLGKAYADTKAHLALTGLRNVTIYLAEGTHYISETFALNAEEINADDYSVKIVGTDGATVSSAQLIDISNAENVDGDVYLVQLPKVDGKYPVIRDLEGYYYTDDVVNTFTMSHKGSEESAFAITGVQFTDGTSTYNGAQGTDCDWYLDEATAAKTTYAILTLASGATAGVTAGAEIHFTSQWSFNIMHVAQVSGDKVYIDYAEFAKLAAHRQNGAGHDLAGDVAWFENGESFFGEANEFAYNQATGALYVNIPSQYFEDYDWMRSSTLENLFAINGANNFSIENVTLTGYAARNLAGTGYGQSGKSGDFVTAAGVYAKDVDGLTVKNVTFENADGAGVAIHLSAKNVIIDSNRFENLGASAIVIAGDSMSMGNTFAKNITITNNYINEIGNTVNNASGIVVQTAANMLIAHNTITNVPYTGISLGWNWEPHGLSEEQVRTGIYRLYNVEVAYNYIADYMLAQHDGGAIYTLGGALTTAEAKQVNFVHHNYVNITGATGEHKGSRYFAAYYHDGGSSNWYNYSNVLMNSKTDNGVIDGLFGGYFVQYNKGNDGYNNLFKGNYAIGFKNNAALYNDVASQVRFSAERGNYAEAYAYASVSALNANTTIVEAGEGDRNCHLIANPNANAAAYVYSIFAAAGASYGASTKASGGLTVTAAAIADEIRLTEELTNASDSNTVLVTFNDGTTSFTVPYAVGDALRVPAEFDKEGFSYVFTIGGATVADLTTVEATGAITVNVAVTASIQDVVVTDGVTTQVYEVSAGDKIPAEALSGFAKEGYSVIYTIDGEIVDINNFTIGAEGVEIWAQYVKNSYTVTFTDGVTEVVKTVPYGDKVTVPASYALKGHATKAHYGELDVTNGYNVPAENITINVSYVAKDYDVIFIDEDGDTELSRVTVTYGTEIPMPETPANKIDGGFVYKFAGWINFEKGMILEEEGLTITANTYDAFMIVTFVDGNGDVFGTIELPANGGVIEAAPEGTPVKDEDETYTYTFTGWAGFEAGMPVEEPTTFVAEFEAVKKVVKYTVTFTVDGVEYLSYEIEEGALITLPETDPTKDGYVFTGWTDYTEGMTATGNLTFAASFEEVPAFELGDVDGSGVIDMNDVIVLLAVITDTVSDSSIVKGETNIDGTGEVDMNDVILLLTML